MKEFMLLVLMLSFISNAAIADEDVLRPKGKPDGYYENVEDDYVFKRSPLALGFEVGGNYNMFSQDISYNPQLNNPVGADQESATGISPFIGVFADFSFNEKFGLHLKLQYNNVYISNTANGLMDGAIFDENGIYDYVEIEAQNE
jgi:hypothetical protein